MQVRWNEVGRVRSVANRVLRSPGGESIEDSPYFCSFSIKEKKKRRNSAEKIPGRRIDEIIFMNLSAFPRSRDDGFMGIFVGIPFEFFTDGSLSHRLERQIENVVYVRAALHTNLLLGNAMI